MTACARGRRAAHRMAAAGLALSMAVAAVAGPSQAREPRASPWEELTPAQPEEATTEESVPYQVDFEGVEDAGLLSVLKAASQLIELRSRPPPTPARLKVRVEDDLKRLNAVLRSEGYYDAVVRSDIDSAQRPAQVVLRFDSGTRYSLADHIVLYEGRTPPPQDLRPGLERLGLELGMPARGPKIAAAEQQWALLMTQRGYPFAEVLDRRAVIDRETETLRVTLRVNAGALARFGRVDVSGLEHVAPVYVERLVPWERGEIYDSREVERLRQRLSQTRIFAAIAIRPGEALDSEGELPVSIELAEGPVRTVGFGVSYSTDVKFGSTVFWEHRNILGHGEQLRFDVTGSEIEQSLEAQLRKPTYPGRAQALVFNTALSNKETDGFDEQSASALVGLESRYLKGWLLTAGVAPEFSDVKQKGEDEEYLLIGLPLSATRDRRDDRLNPTRGTRLKMTVTPYEGLGDDDPNWVTGTVGGSGYLAVDEDARFVLASRTKVGVLFGASNQSVPPSKRFYAGGGGSIRGYEFQSVGDIDNFDDPIGGRSVIELSGELRVRATETIGLVPFVDGGTVYEEAYPDFSNKFRWAAGLGLRYFTGFGPLRLDVAFPINRRDSDDSFQFYVSFGQAF